MESWTKDDYPEVFDKLTKERQAMLLKWIRENLKPRKTFNSRHTSYGLRHLIAFENDAGTYFSNGEFKGAMLKAGYEVKSRIALNWCFNISDRSPVFQKKN